MKPIFESDTSTILACANSEPRQKTVSALLDPTTRQHCATLEVWHDGEKWVIKVSTVLRKYGLESAVEYGRMAMLSYNELLYSAGVCWGRLTERRGYQSRFYCPCRDCSTERNRRKQQAKREYDEHAVHCSGYPCFFSPSVGEWD